jgi:hypothetical protein
MSITAEQLKKTGARGKHIDTVVRDRLHLIDTQLQGHPRTWGRNIHTHDLPTTFPGLGGMEKKTAQMVIYTGIIYSLEDRGFRVKLYLPTSTAAKLYIEWVTDISEEDSAAIEQKLKATILKTAEDLDKFLGKGPPAVTGGSR